MKLLQKIAFQFKKGVRMFKYHLRYTIYKWKQIDGIMLPVYIKYGYSVLRFIDDGTYEQCEIAIVKQTLAKNDVVLELGTGMGFISAYCAKIIGDSRVFTFEGNPKMQPVITELYKRNNVNPVCKMAMLAKDAGEQTFYTNDDNFLGSSAQQQQFANSVTVPVLSLNATIAACKPSYLVMDIEGGEADIFDIVDFQTIKKVQFELHPLVLTTIQVNAIFTKLANAGFVKDDQFSFPNNFFYSRA